MKKNNFLIIIFILFASSLVFPLKLHASPPTIPVTYYVLRENLVRPHNNTYLNWNGYWRIGYGTIISEQEVYDNVDMVQCLLNDVPDYSKYLADNQHIEWYTIRKTSSEWRVEGEIVCNNYNINNSVLQNAMFYLLNDDINRPTTSKALSRLTYYTPIGYGTIDTTDSFYSYSNEPCDEITKHLIYLPDFSSYISNNEYIEWYAIRNNNGIMEVEGEILSFDNSMSKNTAATFYLSNCTDNSTTNTYLSVGYGSIRDPEIINNDSTEVTFHLNSIPDCENYLSDNEEIIWHSIRSTTDSTLWRVDGYIVSSQNDNNFIKVDGDKIVDSLGNPFHIKGIGMGNNVWYSQDSLPTTDHNENSFSELADMGFNSARFYLNASLFEDDSNPYVYKEEAWNWLDKNIEWAKKYDIHLLLNMHIPQGGRITSSNTIFWDDIEYQNRFVSLWKAIAERYASEDIILGYGLLNEPFVTEYSSSDAALDRYYDLINRTIKTLRTVDSNHILFIERPYGILNTITNSTNYVWGTTDSFRLVSDSNTVYEFHFYEPTDFTHQGLSWLNYKSKWVYNSDSIALLSGERLLDQIYKSEPYTLDTTTSEWKHIESQPLTITNSNVNYGYWVIYLYNMGVQSTVYMDNIVIKEFDTNGNYIKDILTFDFNETTPCSGWDLGTNGGGSYSYDSSGGTNASGCAKISNVSSAYRFYRNFDNANINFQLNPTHTYQICADIKLENVSSNSSIELGIQSAICEKVYSFNKEYLEAKLQPFLEFGSSNNVPLFLGEFGVSNYVIKEEYQGDEWLRDMFDLINKYQLGYSYHDYHEQNFGLYTNDSRCEIGSKNEILYNIFMEKVN